MVVYGEYLFAENFIAGGLLLWLTGRMTGYRPRPGRLALAAAVCGVGSFIIFVPLTGLLSAGVRIAIGLVAALAAFGPGQLLKKTAVLLILTFASGGAVMALLLWQQEPAITHQGIIYIDAITYMKLLCFGTVALGLSYWFVRLVRRRSTGLALHGSVRLSLGGRSYDFCGYVDSGNSLREPCSGEPVVLLDKKGARRLPFTAEELLSLAERGADGDGLRVALIPYRTVGESYGLLPGVRAESMTFSGKPAGAAWVAFYDGCFGDYEVLINKDILEGGLLKDV